MRLRQILCFFVLLAPLAGCATNEREPVWEDELDTEPLYFESVAFGNAAMADTVQAVIRDAETWAQLEPRLQTLVPVPEIDFEQWMLVLVALPQEDTGYSLRINMVERKEGGLVATYLLQEPGQDCITTTDPNTPFHLVRIPRTPSEETIRFTRETETFKCGFGVW